MSNSTPEDFCKTYRVSSSETKHPHQSTLYPLTSGRCCCLPFSWHISLSDRGTICFGSCCKPNAINHPQIITIFRDCKDNPQMVGWWHGGCHINGVDTVNFVFARLTLRGFIMFAQVKLLL